MFVWIDSKGIIRESKKPPTNETRGNIVNKDKICDYFKEYLRGLNYCLYKRED